MNLARGVIAVSAAILSAFCYGDELHMIDNKTAPKYRVENSFVGGFILVTGILRNKSMSSDLEAAMNARGFDPGCVLREATMRHLKQSGVNVSRLDYAPNYDEPAKTDYKLAAADKTVFHVYFEKVGVQSRPTQSTYTPFAHVFYCIIPKGRSSCDEFYERGYYGEGYTEREAMIVPAKQSPSWQSYEDVMRNLPSVQDAISNMAEEMGEEVAKSVIETMKTM